MPRDIAGAFVGKMKPDHREFDPRRCCRIFIDAYDGTSLTATTTGAIRHCNFYRAASGVVSHTNLYDSRVGNYFQLYAATATAGSRCWLSERVSAFQNALTAGLAEMDVQAMVRIPTPALGAGANVGFFAAHGVPGPLMYNSIQFEAYSADDRARTWFACTNLYDAANSTTISTRVDTKIPVTDWHALRVWVNKDGNRAVWTIDDVVVREERNASLFPTWANLVARGESAVDIVAASNGMQGGCRVRADDAGVNEELYLDVNWMLYRYFREPS